jgi:hypothetical protein
MAKGTNAQQTDSSDSLTDLRRELEGKIERKLHSQFFYWACGVIALVLVGSLGYFVVQINSANNKYDSLINKVTVLETKMDERKRY